MHRNREASLVRSILKEGFHRGQRGVREATRASNRQLTWEQVWLIDEHLQAHPLLLDCHSAAARRRWLDRHLRLMQRDSAAGSALRWRAQRGTDSQQLVQLGLEKQPKLRSTELHRRLPSIGLVSHAGVLRGRLGMCKERLNAVSHPLPNRSYDGSVPSFT